MSAGQPVEATTIAWIDGRWGAAAELSLPLLDRGLLLADGLFETVLVQAGRPQLLEQHLERWSRSAAELAMAPPPGQAALAPLIAEAIERAGLAGGSRCGALRLNWSRGIAAGRGIDLPTGGPTEQADTAPAHRFWLQLSPCTPLFSAQTARISRQERRNADSRLSRCKTFAYGQAIQARHEARLAGADDALLLNGSGDLCCGTTANLLVQREGCWLTPPLSSGCLPGVMRGRALQLGLARETRLQPDVQTGDRWLLLNSLSARPLRALDHQPLEPLSAEDAEAFWRRLL
jgi:branched-subunit amino acid aminotransferase/4-amino-4-deoxychorismate lyase